MEDELKKEVPPINWPAVMKADILERLRNLRYKLDYQGLWTQVQTIDDAIYFIEKYVDV